MMGNNMGYDGIWALLEMENTLRTAKKRKIMINE